MTIVLFSKPVDIFFCKVAAVLKLDILSLAAEIQCLSTSNFCLGMLAAVTTTILSPGPSLAPQPDSPRLWNVAASDRHSGPSAVRPLFVVTAA